MLFAALSLAGVSLQAGSNLDLTIGTVLEQCDPLNVSLTGTITDDGVTQFKEPNDVMLPVAKVTPSQFSASATLGANELKIDFFNEFQLAPDHAAKGGIRGPLFDLKGYVDLDPNQGDIYVSTATSVYDLDPGDEIFSDIAFTDS